MNDAPACVICHRDLWHDETSQQACRICQQRIDDHLRAIAGPSGLYARLCLRIEPGARSIGPRVSGSATASMPADGFVLNDTAEGGIVGILEDWVTDWAALGLGVIGTGGRLQYRVDQAVATLRRNLPQAVERHPAIAAFGTEIYLIRRRCEYRIDGTPVAQFKVTCDCERSFWIPVDATGITCPNLECGADYGYEQLRRMAAAQRAAA